MAKRKGGKPFGYSGFTPAYEPAEFEKELEYRLPEGMKPSQIKKKQGILPWGGVLTSALLSTLIGGGLGAGIGALATTVPRNRADNILGGAGLGAFGGLMSGLIASPIIEAYARGKKNGKKEYEQYAKNLDKNAWKHLLPFYGSYNEGLKKNMIDSSGIDAIVGYPSGNYINVAEMYGRNGNMPLQTQTSVPMIIPIFC